MSDTRESVTRRMVRQGLALEVERDQARSLVRALSEATGLTDETIRAGIAAIVAQQLRGAPPEEK